MRGITAAILAMAMLAVPLAFATTASAAPSDLETKAVNLTPKLIGPMPTDRFGGGELVGLQAGDAVFGVRYGVEGHPNNVLIFAEYKRFLGAADVVDGEGRYLATRGIPVYTVLGQSLDRFIEFQHVNASEAFDLNSLNDSMMFPMSTYENIPMKELPLFAAWTLGDVTNETVGATTYVNFTVSASNLHYHWVRNGTEAGDGVLNSVAFTFHLRVDVVDRSGQIPWYKVTVTDGTPREIIDVEFLYWKQVSGRADVMGAKYDHSIEGWDFANATDKLALETHFVFGNYFPDRTVDFVHYLYFHDHADDGNTTVASNETGPTRPTFYTKDRIYFDDNWTRVGRFEWLSDVTVDGVTKTMAFEVQDAARFSYVSLEHGAFLGFTVRGAFVYPAGQSIFHDPAMSAEMFVPNLTTGFNLTPLGMLLIQAAVVGVAIIPALYLRSKARRQN